MAPVLDPPIAGVVTITPWPLFTVFGVDGHPLVGGKLYTYAANTSQDKPSFADPFLIVPNANPVILDDQGQAMVYLDGFYRLVLTDADNVQLWEVDNYEWPTDTEVPPGGIVNGSTDGVANAIAGESVISVPNLVPLGYRVEGVIVRVDTSFGTANGLQQIAVGDSQLMDGWGMVGLTAGLVTGQRDWHRADRLIAATAYTVLLAAVGGRFDSAGVMSIRAHWSSIGGWA